MTTIAKQPGNPDTSEFDGDKFFDELNTAITGKSDELSRVLAAYEPKETPTEVVPAEPVAAPEAEPVAETPAPETVPETPVTLTAEEQLQKLREDYEKLTHRFNSEAGRVPYLQRELTKLREQAAAATPPVQPAAPAQQTPAQNARLQETLKKLQETDPMLADELGAAFTALKEEIQADLGGKIAATRQTVEEQRYNEYIQHEQKRLLERHPYAYDVFKTPDWKEWKEQQPANLRNMASSDNADEVSAAIDLFGAYVRRKYPEQATTATAQPSPTPTVDPTSAAKADQARKLEEDRRRRLAASAPSSSAAAAAAGDVEPSDPDELLKFYYEKLQRQNGRLR